MLLLVEEDIAYLSISPQGFGLALMLVAVS